MELLLIRHGKAEGHGHPGGDGARALAEKGHLQAQRVGKFLRDQGMLPDLVLTSPLVRATQTAEGVCAAAGIDPPVVEAWIACGMDPAEALRELAAYRESVPRIAIVGHEPDFSELAEAVTGADPGTIRVKKASVILLTLDPPRPRGTLHFNLWPEFLP
ncbi:MAG: phosphohistidine phosphatase SixA [Akkermansiaceae bacterium]|nr:phosphohistidine phosphatase SixA [Akkermansiaceae bacterium]NNM28315.1 phosphohistidine phosphatase SixA [Akkermansiaceae bacterium]